MNQVNRFIQYAKDARSELRHVSWPTRHQAVIYTIIVVVIALAVAFFLGFFDFIFTEGLDRFII